MKNLSFTLKIITIFLIPAIALIYFSFYFIHTKYDNLNESEKYKLSAEITEKLSKLIHNIQKERGLSAGYIVSKQQKKIKEKLIRQYAKTDLSYQIILNIINTESNAKSLLLKELEHKNKPYIKEIIYQFSKINYIRQIILKNSINFQDEMQYYTHINKQLINSIKSFVILLKNQNQDNMALSKLQNLKEYAGQERAYIYKELLSPNKNKNNINTVIKLQKLQHTEQEDFMLNASIKITFIYSTILKKETLTNIKELRELFSKNELTSSNAQEWFNYTTLRIDMLEDISTKILNLYIEKADDIYNKAIVSLYATAILWILLLISLSALTYMLRNLIKKEEKNTEELRISSYTFDSHEAMTITDVNGIILKVNNGFTRITGYSASEVIGKNPRVLKSMKHDDSFYKEMWRKIHTTGKWSDDIYNKRKNGEIYLERLSITAIKDEKDITTHYIAQFLDISEVKKAQEFAQYQANHDYLTNLANRKYLIKRLNEEFVKARRHNFLHAFLFIDLDDFKKINDTFGHNIGDLLIKEVALRLKSLIREEDLIARIGGDEFAIILQNISKTKTEAEASIAVKRVTTKILNALAEPFLIEEYKIETSSSIGVKLFPYSDKNAQDVIIHADTAMYQAKKQGKNQVIFFNRAIELEIKQLSLLEEEIKNGFYNDEFVLFYQPKIDVNSGQIAGAELLARWQHPTKNILYPDSFIKVITDMGLVHNLTIIALHTACKFIKKNDNLFNGKLAININSNELLHPSFEKEVIDIITSYDVSPTKIELEILEDEIIQDFDLVVTKILKLQEFGINFSIDDFGTGYSSITYLKQLPLNTLKIDRDFLLNSEDSTGKELIKIIINMAKIFEMDIVVEGVENNNQLEFIRDNGAKLYQGFFFSRAIKENLFIEMLEKETK